jgi:serine/threonine-protein kinase
MKKNDIIASQYKILDILEYFNFEQFCLAQKLGIENPKYFIQNIDLTNKSELEKSKLKEKITQIKKLNESIKTNNRFLTIVDILNETNDIIILYEKIEGISLKEEFKNNKLWTEEEAIIGLKYLLESLSLIHDQNLTHQIIKPQNIIVADESKQLIINNYGKITSMDSSLMVTITIEDKLYIAPEQIRGKPIFSSDIYGLGMVIISMLTGKNALNLEEDDDGKLIWTNTGNFTTDLVRILDKMIATKISKRYENVSDILRDIKQHFPLLENVNIVNDNTSYTPTEIFSVNEESSGIESNLNPTEIIHSDHNSTVDLISYPHNPSPIISETQLIPVCETENKQASLSNHNHDHILSTGQNLLSSSIESDKIKQKNVNNSELNLVNNSRSKKAKNFLLNTKIAIHVFRQIKTPKGIMISFLISLLIIFSFGFMKNYLYQKKVNNLMEEIKSYYEQKQYNECITLINSDQTQSLSIANVITQEFLGKCQLGLAELEAAKGQFSEAIKIAVKIDDKSSDYIRAKTFIDDWSEQILKEAKTLCPGQNDSSLIEEKLANIPESSIWKKEALDLIQECQNNDQNVDPGIPLCPGSLCPE